MKSEKKIKKKSKLKLGPGFKQFLWKTGIFVILFGLIQLSLILLQKAIMPTEYYFLADVDIGKALLLTAMIFFFLTRENLKLLRKYSFELKTTLIFNILSIISFVGYNVLKGFLSHNPIYAVENILLFYPLKELTLILGTIFLFIAIFGIRFTKDFVKNFKKQIGITIIVFILALFLIVEFQRLWVYFSYAVSKMVYWLLNLTFDAVLSFTTGGTPQLGILNNFVVSIGKPCSGVDSMLMFIFLYVFIAGFDWKVFNKKKLAVMFIPGVISVFLLNIIRIYLLITIGAFVSESFAIGFFHTNASMILFLGYFVLFWGLLYKWMKR